MADEIVQAIAWAPGSTGRVEWRKKASQQKP